MKRAYLLRTMIAAAVGLAMASGSLLAQGTIEFDGGDAHDWGVVQPGKLQTTMVIKNVGKGDLTITEVKPTCGCTLVQPGKTLLKPGDTTQVPVTMTASGMGQMRKLITVHSSDPVHPISNFALIADVRPTMLFQPTDYFLVNNTPVGAEMTATITLTNHSDKPFTVEPLELIESNAKVRFDRKEPATVEPGASLALYALITPQLNGSVNGRIMLRTSAEGYEQREIHIWGSATDQVSSDAAADH